ncbi:MAG: hypothetical protein ACQEUT_18210 [Bacillota bacterium]
MKEYTNTRYPELSFYVGSKRRQFVGGQYTAESKEEIEVLDKLADVKAVEQEKKSESKAPAARKKASEK